MQIFGIHILTAMTIAGALGGLLFGYGKRGLVFPSRSPEQKHSLDLGFIADCAFGAAGAIVVFIIIPLDLQDGGDTAAHLAHQIRILAVAFIGGYGGRAIIDVALARTLKDVTKRTEEIAEQTTKRTEEIAAQTNAVKSKLDLHENQQSLDMNAFELVDIHLSDTMMHTVSAHDLTDAIKVASPAALENIYQRAKETRHHVWRQKQEGQATPQLTERTIPIFQGPFGVPPSSCGQATPLPCSARIRPQRSSKDRIGRAPEIVWNKRSRVWRRVVNPCRPSISLIGRYVRSN